MACVRVMVARRLACNDAGEVCSFAAFACVSNLARCARARASVTSGARLLVLRCDAADERVSSGFWKTMCFKSFLAGREGKQAARQEAGVRVLVKAGTHLLDKAGCHMRRGRCSPGIEAGCRYASFRQKQLRLLACCN